MIPKMIQLKPLPSDDSQLYYALNKKEGCGVPFWGDRKQAQIFVNRKKLATILKFLKENQINFLVVPLRRKLSQEQQFQIYKEFYRLSQKAAVRFAARYGQCPTSVVEEAESFLAELITEKWDRWDPTRSSFGTWAYNATYWFLQNKTQRETSRFRHNPYAYESAAAKSSLLDKMEVEVSQDARDILKYIREDPARVEREFKALHTSRILQEQIVLSFNWDWDRMKRAWFELQEVFNGD